MQCLCHCPLQAAAFLARCGASEAGALSRGLCTFLLRGGRGLGLLRAGRAFSQSLRCAFNVPKRSPCGNVLNTKHFSAFPAKLARHHIQRLASSLASEFRSWLPGACDSEDRPRESPEFSSQAGAAHAPSTAQNPRPSEEGRGGAARPPGPAKAEDSRGPGRVLLPRAVLGARHG